MAAEEEAGTFVCPSASLRSSLHRMAALTLPRAQKLFSLGDGLAIAVKRIQSALGDPPEEGEVPVIYAHQARLIRVLEEAARDANGVLADLEFDSLIQELVELEEAVMARDVAFEDEEEVEDDLEMDDEGEFDWGPDATWRDAVEEFEHEALRSGVETWGRAGPLLQSVMPSGAKVRNPFLALIHRQLPFLESLVSRIVEIRKKVEDLCVLVEGVGSGSEDDEGATSIFNAWSRITQWLLNLPGDNPDSGDIGVLAIVGEGGSGKTFLAQAAYDDDTVTAHFQLRVWVDVGGDLDVRRLTKRMLEAVVDAPLRDSDIEDLDTLQEFLREKLIWKRFLLVLDDVRDEDHAKWAAVLAPWMNGEPGSKILVTTRDAEVADMVQTTRPITLRRNSASSPDSMWAQKPILTGSRFGESSSPSQKEAPSVEGSTQYMGFSSRMQSLMVTSTRFGGSLPSHQKEAPAIEEQTLDTKILTPTLTSPQFGDSSSSHQKEEPAKEGKEVLTSAPASAGLGFWESSSSSERPTPDAEALTKDKNGMSITETPIFVRSLSGDSSSFSPWDTFVEERTQETNIMSMIEMPKLIGSQFGESPSSSLQCDPPAGVEMTHHPKFVSKTLETLSPDLGLRESLSSSQEASPIAEELNQHTRSISMTLTNVLTHSRLGEPLSPSSKDAPAVQNPAYDKVFGEFSSSFYQTGSPAVVERHRCETLLKVAEESVEKLKRTLPLAVRIIRILLQSTLKEVMYHFGAIESPQCGYYGAESSDSPNFVVDSQNLCDPSPVESIESGLFLKFIMLRSSSLCCDIRLSCVLDGLYSKLKYLTTLDLSFSPIKDIPNSIDELNHLCVLNLNYTNITRLPESLCHLSSLQILSLRQCNFLQELPSCINKLVRLKTHHISGCLYQSSLPEGLLQGYTGDLGFLKTEDHEKHSVLSEGKRQEIPLSSLGGVALQNHQEMMPLVEDSTLEKYYDSIASCLKEVLEHVKPLWRLEIQYHRGQHFGTLINRESVVTLESMTLPHDFGGNNAGLHLNIFRSSLSIAESDNDNDSVTMCLQDHLTSLHSLSVSSSTNIVPLLEEALPHMQSLYELEIDRCKGLAPLLSTQADLPSLKVLSIRGCSDLRSLSGELLHRMTSLETLRIVDCNEVSTMCFEDLFSLTNLWIEKCPKLLDAASEDMVPGLLSLSIDNTSILGTGFVDNLSSLQELYIHNCTKLSCFTKEEVKGLQNLASLQCLEIAYCYNFSNLPIELHSFTSVKSLRLTYCPKIRSFPSKGLPKFLEELYICGCPMLREWCQRSKDACILEIASVSKLLID